MPRSRLDVLQWIDRRVGVPVCFAFTGLRRFLGLFRRRRRAVQPPQNILFIKLAEQGSTVLARAAIADAVRRVGRENVHFLVFEENRFIVDILGLIPADNVHEVRTGSLAAMAASGVARIVDLRRLRIEACVDMEFFSRFSAALCPLIGSPIRVGFHSYFGEGPYRGDLFTHRVLYNPHRHTSAIFAGLVRALDMDPADLPTFDAVLEPPVELPLFEPLAGERESVRRILADRGIPPEGRIVLLNANASDLLPLRKWNPANYTELARRLIAIRPDTWVVFTGAPDEAPLIEPLAQSVGSPRCLSLAGRTTLRDLLVLCGYADALVTNDSGPAHFAALTEVDVVVLFGPETPLLFAATGPRNHPISANLACSPCVNAFNNRQTVCRDNVCMQRIPVERVLAEVETILNRRPPKRRGPAPVEG